MAFKLHISFNSSSKCASYLVHNLFFLLHVISLKKEPYSLCWSHGSAEMEKFSIFSHLKGHKSTTVEKKQNFADKIKNGQIFADKKQKLRTKIKSRGQNTNGQKTADKNQNWRTNLKNMRTKIKTDKKSPADKSRRHNCPMKIKI